MIKIGFLLNSFAGLGGAAGLKGSDGSAIREQALLYHQLQLQSPKRALRFLKLLQQQPIAWLTGNGCLGEDCLLEAGMKAQVLPVLKNPNSSEPADSKALLKQFLQQQVDIIVFAGGDGTARDVCDVVGQTQLVLGVPAGVKMQSGVFAITPEAGSDIIKSLLNIELARTTLEDVRDIDEQALRQSQVRSRFYGSMQVPQMPEFMQHVKQGGVENEDLVLDDISDALEDIMHDEERLMLLGPGKTTAHFLQRIGRTPALVGFDAVLAGELIASDITAKGILQLQQQYPDLLLVLSPTGNQGVLLGRGNQQIGPEFLQNFHLANLCVVSSKAKLKALEKRPLITDITPECDAKFTGFIKVVCGFNDQVLYPINTRTNP